jgi:hypothetical protein
MRLGTRTLYSLQPHSGGAHGAPAREPPLRLCAPAAKAERGDRGTAAWRREQPAASVYGDRADLWSSNLRFGWLQQSNTGLFLVYNDSHPLEDISQQTPSAGGSAPTAVSS